MSLLGPVGRDCKPSHFLSESGLIAIGINVNIDVNIESLTAKFNRLETQQCQKQKPCFKSSKDTSSSD